MARLNTNLVMTSVMTGLCSQYIGNININHFPDQIDVIICSDGGSVADETFSPIRVTLVLDLFLPIDTLLCSPSFSCVNVTSYQKGVLCFPLTSLTKKNL